MWYTPIESVTLRYKISKRSPAKIPAFCPAIWMSSPYTFGSLKTRLIVNVPAIVNRAPISQLLPLSNASEGNCASGLPFGSGTG